MGLNVFLLWKNLEWLFSNVTVVFHVSAAKKKTVAEKYNDIALKQVK